LITAQRRTPAKTVHPEWQIILDYVDALQAEHDAANAKPKTKARSKKK
jgi:hypothetical protein